MIRRILVPSLMVGLTSGALVVTTACGGGDEQPPAQGTQPVPVPGGEVDERPPAKMPRPPFLSLSESDSIAEKILSKGKERSLATAPQRGPFGDGESTTVIYTEPVEGLETSGVGGVVVRGSSAIELPFENDAALVPDKPIDVVWASGEHGWQLVVLLQRERVDGAAQENQAFYWDGTTYARDTMAEERVRTMTSPSTIRQTLL